MKPCERGSSNIESFVEKEKKYQRELSRKKMKLLEKDIFLVPIQ